MKRVYKRWMVLMILIITVVISGCGRKTDDLSMVENQSETAIETAEAVTTADEAEKVDETETVSVQVDDSESEEEEASSKEEPDSESDDINEDKAAKEPAQVKEDGVIEDKETDKAKAEPQADADTAKGAEAPAVPELPAEPIAIEPVPVAPVPVPVAAANVVIIGDSRCVQMRDSTGGGGCVWICENGKRYEWFAENAVPRADAVVGKGTKVVVCMGVNDPGDASKYAALVNVMAAQWAARGAKTYYVSVNPVWENPYTSEEEVMNFNATILPQLVGVRWIDTHTYLMNTGYNLVDGLHYDNATNVKIFSAIIGSL